VTTLARSLALLGAALWLGGGVGTLLSTRAAFRHAGGTPVAGQIAADALRSLSRLVWASLALLALAAALGARAPMYGWLPGAALFLAGELGVKPALQRMRRDASGSIETLAKDDPRRKRFGALHGVSMLLLLGQLLCAAFALLALAR
jgi:hypothetical protein